MTTGDILILSIIIVAISFILLSKLENIQKTETVISNKSNGMLYRNLNAKYLGGFPDLEGGKKADIKITRNEIVIMIGSSRRLIPRENIINAEIQTKQQINSNVNLGKLIVFGWLAFGMKKEDEFVNYLIITYKDNKDVRNIVLKTNDLENLTRIVRNNCLN